MTTLERFSVRTWLTATSVISGISTAFAADPVPAGAGGGLGGIPGGVPGVAGTDSGAVRIKVVAVLNTVLNFLALLAVIFIIIAGIRLIVSQGEQEQKEKAKKTIIYVIVGLIVILFAKLIVGFFSNVSTYGS